MKHFYFSILFLILSLSAYSQDEVIKQDNYSASNGITYSDGDHFILGKGSIPNGKFRYISSGGWDEVLNSLTEITGHNLDASAANTEAKIKKIKKFRNRDKSTVVFKIGVGDLTNYYINIEKAISTCEVEKCKSLDQRVRTAFETPIKKTKNAAPGEIEKIEVVDEVEIAEANSKIDLKAKDSLNQLEEVSFSNENLLAETDTSKNKETMESKVKDDSLWPKDKEGKYIIFPIYALFLSIGIISWFFYRKYRIQDGRFKTGYRMPNLGFRKMAGKVVYIIILTIILTPIGYLLIYLGII